MHNVFRVLMREFETNRESPGKLGRYSRAHYFAVVVHLVQRGGFLESVQQYRCAEGVRRE